MNEVVKQLIVMGVALAASWASVRLGDRQLLVPPPDAVAESFARLVVAERYELAVTRLSHARRQALGAEGLRATVGDLRAEVGDVTTVDAVADWVEDARAAARASIEAECGTAVLPLRFVRERGLWVIDEVPGRAAIDVDAHPC
jgi:hypothetical protein